LNTLENAIASLAQIDVVLDILQGKKQYTNGNVVAMVLVVAEMEWISDVLTELHRTALDHYRKNPGAWLVQIKDAGRALSVQYL
jgi:hypothetical protein